MYVSEDHVVWGKLSWFWRKSGILTRIPIFFKVWIANFSEEENWTGECLFDNLCSLRKLRNSSDNWLSCSVLVTTDRRNFILLLYVSIELEASSILRKMTSLNGNEVKYEVRPNNNYHHSCGVTSTIVLVDLWRWEHICTTMVGHTLRVMEAQRSLYHHNCGIFLARDE